jgi:aspartyl-tRNA(Asn)/glutamyl-tRNA(Gln) amidotransferase subunit C
VIDREQVLHVARLARLQLTDDEVERMTGELAKILDHIDTIEQLDLEGVPPTSHVVEVANALRPDVPRPSLDREVALAAAPERTDDSFVVPSPQAG